MYCTVLLSLLLLQPASFTLAGNRTAAPPYFDQDPRTHVLALKGGSAKLLCKARGSPKPSLLWYKGRDIIAWADRIHIAKYALRIDRVVKSDKGVYRCEASNKHGKKWVNYTLSVVAPPHFHRDPNTTLLASEGEEVKFRCKALGKPRPHVFWYKGNDLVGLNDRINTSKYALHIDPVAKSDEGVYRCEASNEYGKKWVNYTLSVEDTTNHAYARSSSTISVNSGRLIHHDPAFIGGVSAVFIVVIFAIVLFAILWRRYKKRDP
ncbi:contactin-2-like isoform X2 [Littorina saxatilis]|uniref:contactin-2-like isoform X2 n=1 Tax=Littorina saxatilis TaxID=31220 RepID=UPI0038B61012